MKRNIVFLFVTAVSLMLGLAACNESAPKIAVIDAEKIYQDSALAKQGMAHVEGLSRQFNERIAEMRDEVVASPDDEALGLKLQEELMGLQQKFEEEQTVTAEKLNKLLEDVVEEYRQKNGLEVILPKQLVLAVRPGADITAEVTKLFDSKNVEFGSAPAAAPAAAPATESGVAAPAQPSAGASADAPAPDSEQNPAPGVAPEAAPGTEQGK